jgi:phosphatidylethanolamine-binding protein (PEBP) family uncharacterized protein
MRRLTPASSRLSAGTPMHRAGGTTAVLALLAAIVLSGCSNVSTSNNGLAAPAPVLVKVKSSAIAGKTLPAVFTCDGKNIWPPLSWGAVPSSVEELALFALAAVRTKGGRTAIKIEWAMAGIKPTVHSLAAGEIPHGAFVLANTSGKRQYSICPPRGHTQRYSFSLFALPPGARAFAALPSTALLSNLNTPRRGAQATAFGFLSANYTRR